MQVVQVGGASSWTSLMGRRETELNEQMMQNSMFKSWLL
jgi:hypothetical protein